MYHNLHRKQYLFMKNFRMPLRFYSWCSTRGAHGNLAQSCPAHVARPGSQESAASLFTTLPLYSRKFPAFLYLFIIPKYITNSSADAKIHATGLAKSPDNSYNAKQPQPSALFLPALQSLPSWEGIHIPFPGYRFGIHLPH